MILVGGVKRSKTQREDKPLKETEPEGKTSVSVKKGAEVKEKAEMKTKTKRETSTKVVVSQSDTRKAVRSPLKEVETAKRINCLSPSPKKARRASPLVNNLTPTKDPKSKLYGFLKGFIR
jgi:hypothetical protein